MKSKTCCLTFFLFIPYLFFIGCNTGPNTGFVSGVVTIDGQAVEQVCVEFSPKSGQRPAIGYTDTKGYYYLRFTQDKNGCIPGENLVRITAYRTSDEESQYLPGKYNKTASENPEMNVTVKKGKQTFNFELKTKE